MGLVLLGVTHGKNVRVFLPMVEEGKRVQVVHLSVYLPLPCPGSKTTSEITSGGGEWRSLSVRGQSGHTVVMEPEDVGWRRAPIGSQPYEKHCPFRSPCVVRFLL